MRGNLLLEMPAAIPARSIPAYAGEPLVLLVRRKPDEVYPRVCGGTAPTPGWGGCALGLSPRMRGNRHPLVRATRPGGSIPAYAGEPPASPTPSHTRPLYPRVCGGTPRRRRYTSPAGGLSPRMRGNHTSCWRNLNIFGSIPAYAGEPHPHPRQRANQTVYPRVCGGTTQEGGYNVNIVGLSPRMRGNRCADSGAEAAGGSIPAYAGEPPRAARHRELV